MVAKPERKHIIKEAPTLCPPLPSLPPTGLDANAAGEAAGLAVGTFTGIPIAAQTLTGGVLTPQAEGSFRALDISTVIPALSGSPRSWHKHTGLLSTNPASSGQHGLSGLVRLLPIPTKLKQSDMLSNTGKQSMDGPGAAADDGPGAISGATIGDCAAAFSGRAKRTIETTIIAAAAVALVIVVDSSLLAVIVGFDFGAESWKFTKVRFIQEWVSTEC